MKGDADLVENSEQIDEDLNVMQDRAGRDDKEIGLTLSMKKNE